MTTKLLILLAVLSATPDLARAEEDSRLGYRYSEDLLADCSNAANLDYCFGYIASVHDTVRAYETWLNMREMCVPPGTSQGELRDVVIEHLRTHPLDLNGQAASVVIIALRNHYACPTAAAVANTPTPPRN